ncbi:uncharacterized protein LOC110111910 isoform X1 [Dendrobium catenatum]|uniref:uncharacterized protein LOC110111910 isoform X1 n=1 Tax=Dendrobium catenatum TaxID=906689 RepID=UPI0009F540F1|nr:uncharacterized protein LOC110111910 isoform X1 [Dendrobium catenatum]
MARPERSDVHLPPEEAKIIEEETRRYFEEMIPKRHPKPARSDPDGFARDLGQSDGDSTPPELQKLQELNAEQQALVCEGYEAVEEYVETGYYSGLHCINKQHHTTGSGFIKMEKPKGSNLNLKSVSAFSSPASCSCNPATNDWIPQAETVGARVDNMVIPVSHKPNRSES